MARLAVVGGGITGLAAAYEASATSGHEVVLFEASDRVGGKISSSPFAGIDAVDEGADAFLARVPWGVRLAEELGLRDSLTSPSQGSAYVAWDGQLLPIPDGLVLGVPKGLGGLARSRLLSPIGKARAAIEPLLPRRSIDHDSLGRLIRDRFGDEVLERLVDPLVGSINAGDADRLSLSQSVPQLHAAASRHRSLLLGLRRAPQPAAGPVFFTPRAGVSALVDALAEVLTARGVAIRLGTAAQRVVPDGAGERVDDESFDGVVVATPAFVAAAQLDIPALSAVPYAGVAMLTMTIDEALPAGSGYLVPKPQQRHVTAVSFASNKWAHWQPTTGRSLLRVSLGRHGNEAPMEWDDEQIVTCVVDEIGTHLGRSITPDSIRVTRWRQAFPQYLPGHAAHVRRVRESVPPTVALAGAAYEGIGIPACIRQGREAAEALRQRLADRAE